MLVALGAGDCERIGTGFLAQPANAVSSLAYVAVGGWLLLRAADPDRDRISLVSAGTALAGVGLASAGYHGPQPAWAEPVHDATILWLGVVLAGHTVRRLTRRGDRSPGTGTARRWWVAAGACGAAGLAVYVMGRTGGPLCRPESLWQPHAAWHALSAVALGAAVLALTPPPRAVGAPLLP
ncbi:MAG: hypothetical protein ACRD0C_12420 [Acidimicrobiia bacterium]